MRRVSIVLAAVLLLAACGTSSPTHPAPATTTADTTSAGSRHTPADVDFVRALIPHHQQGIALARGAASEPGARTLAEAIIVTQQDEVVRMSGWLKDWSEPVPESASPVTSPTNDPIRALIAHQEEAIKLAQQEQANGTNPTALSFAKQVIESRAAEITQLRSYLS